MTRAQKIADLLGRIGSLTGNVADVNGKITALQTLSNADGTDAQFNSACSALEASANAAKDAFAHLAVCAPIVNTAGDFPAPGGPGD